MKNLKKILALVMAFAMAFTMMAGAAFTDAADIKANDAVNMLTALGVIEGNPDGSFKPDNTVTRAEMAKMIFVVRNNKIDDSAYQTNSTKFVDITGHWAAGYIKFCETQGIIAGKDATHFDPDATVTGVEAAKMLLVVAGYDADKAVLTGPNWSANTLKYAGSAGILDDVNSGLEAGLPRQYAAQMIYNTLDVNRVKWSTDSDSFDDLLNGGVKETVGKAYMGLTKTVGILTTVSKDSITLTGVDKAESDLDKNEKPYATSFTKVKEDYSSLLGQKVKVMFKDGKSNNVLGVYAISDNESYTVNASGVEADDKKVKFGGKSYSIENAYGNDYIDVYYTAVNGSESNLIGSEDASTGGTAKDVFTNQAGQKFNAKAPNYGFTAKELFDNWDTSAATMSFVDSDGNGRFDSVIITDYTAAEVSSVTSSKIVAGKSYNFDDENIDENLAKDDWAIISYDRYNDCQKIEKADVVTGKLSGMKKDSKSKNTLSTYNEYQIDSTWYNGAEDKDGNTDINTVKAGNTVEAIIVNGVAYKMKRSSGTSTAGDVTDIAMVINKDAGIGGNQVKLQFFNDTTKVVDVDDDSTIKYGALNVGQLYEYSISGGEYSFETPVPTKDYYGDYTFHDKYAYSIGKDAINGKTIDDKAKVILFKSSGSDKGNDSKVLTGKQLKNLDNGEYNVIGGKAYYFTAEMNGLDRAGAVAFTINALPTTTSSNDYYAYILNDVRETGSNEISYLALLENGETVTVTEKNAKTADRQKNTLIGYKSLTDEDDNGVRYIDDVHAYTLDESGFGLDAINKVSSNKGTVEFVNHGERDVTADTVVFYVDTDAKTGSTEGSIRTASKYVSDGVKIGNTDPKMANCLYLDKDKEDLEVLVVESGDNQFRGPYADNYSPEGYASIKVADASAATANTADVDLTFEMTKTDVAKDLDIKLVNAPYGFTLKTATKTDDQEKQNVVVTADKNVARGEYQLTFAIVDSKGETVATATATAKLTGALVSSITFQGSLTTAAGTALSAVSAITAPANGDVTIVPASTVVTVEGKSVVDAYELVVGDVVNVTMSIKAAAGKELASNLTVADIGIAKGVVSKNNGETATVVYSFTVPKTKIAALTISNTLSAPAAAAVDTFVATVPDLVGLTNVNVEKAAAWTVAGKTAGDKLTVSYTLTPVEGYEFDTTSITSVTASNLTNITVAITSKAADKIVITLEATVQA
ncbi:S-layer homology domain-containing protein [Intestinibacillus massiliensis]|uniref:S-layer homology domain-containing protein n=1 Tax=Intestinibacillus massiliensis TaxID=1871029 RepID=UPI00135639F2|nr:S-layer homology domain-containing protein [Intestinibacillus massiliensis]